jgi:hypothetical protein
VIPNTVTNLGGSAFSGCASLTNVTIPNGLTSIGDNMFLNCASLASVAIPIGVTTIGEAAFAGSGLTSVTIPDSVTNIPYEAFYSCASLTNVTIGNGVTELASWAFSYCHHLTSVTIGSSVIHIDYGVFYDCPSLTTVTIGNSLASIREEAFFACPSLMGVYFKGNAPTDVDSFVFTGDNRAAVYYLPGATGWGPTFGDRPTALWRPLLETSEGSFGVRTNQFGFNINWASGMVVVVEACTNFANPVWQPVQTNTLTGSSCFFNDPAWTNYACRFYRLRSQ